MSDNSKSQTAKPSDLSMDVKIRSPFKNYYEGEAFSVSAVNLKEPFNILPKSHNLITLLRPCELVITTARGEQRINISGGIMQVKSDKIVVFLDT